MNNRDFDTILLETMDHSTLESFLEAKREDFRCNKKEFEEGLKDSIERFDRLASSGNNEHFDDEGNDLGSFSPNGEIEIFEADNGFFVIEITMRSQSYFFDIETTDDFLKRINKYLKSSDFVKPDHSGLFNVLKKYLSGINANEFSCFIENKSFPSDPPNAIWKGSKAEARYFADHFTMGIPDFNLCFTLKNGDKLKYHDKPTTKKPFKELLKPYLPK